MKIVVCETQPVTAEGFRALCACRDEMELVEAASSLTRCLEVAREYPGCVVLLDKAFGSQAVTGVISDLSRCDGDHRVVVWGIGMSESETVRYLRAGARGVLSKSDGVGTVLACLATVAGGGTWAELQVRPPARMPGGRPGLTQREREVLELVGQGLRNREVAIELGIRPGTVKVHLKHIFEKTGAPDRHALVLARLIDGRDCAGRTAQAVLNRRRFFDNELAAGGIKRCGDADGKRDLIVRVADRQAREDRHAKVSEDLIGNLARRERRFE